MSPTGATEPIPEDFLCQGFLVPGGLRSEELRHNPALCGSFGGLELVPMGIILPTPPPSPVRASVHLLPLFTESPWVSDAAKTQTHAIFGGNL